MTDFTPGRGDRDELARVIAIANKRATSPIALRDDDAADVLWSAGWRKKPSVEVLADFIAERRDAYPRRADDMDSEELAHAILALLDGPTETGEK